MGVNYKALILVEFDLHIGMEKKIKAESSSIVAKALVNIFSKAGCYHITIIGKSRSTIEEQNPKKVKKMNSAYGILGICNPI